MMRGMAKKTQFLLSANVVSEASFMVEDVLRHWLLTK